VAHLPDDMIAYNRQLIDDFRTNGAPLGRALLLLSTTGRRTGLDRTSPMMYVRLDGRLLVIASNAGAADHPQWYLNLLADPRVRVEIGEEAYDAIATPLRDEERDEAFVRIAHEYPFFFDHQAGITRTIPVVALDRVPTDG
jgi:deazaflavin-dependent oxidoreductase (nitroreductase family)